MRVKEQYLKIIGILFVFLIISVIFQQVFLVDRDRFDLPPDETMMREVELESGDHVKWKVESTDTIEVRLSTDPDHFLFGTGYLGPLVMDSLDADMDTVYYFSFVNDRSDSTQVVRFSVNYNWMGIGLVLIAIQLISFGIMILLFVLWMQGTQEPGSRRKKRARKAQKKDARRRR